MSMRLLMNHVAHVATFINYEVDPNYRTTGLDRKKGLDRSKYAGH
jgi:hypothetical protein